MSEVVDGVDRVRRCDCWRQSIAGHQLTHSRIPRRYQHCQLSNFEQTVDSLREAHRRAPPPGDARSSDGALLTASARCRSPAMAPGGELRGEGTRRLESPRRCASSAGDAGALSPPLSPPPSSSPSSPPPSELLQLLASSGDSGGRGGARSTRALAAGGRCTGRRREPRLMRLAFEKDDDGNDQVVCLLAGESIPAILKSISEFHQDAEWIRVEKEIEVNGKLRSGVVAYKLTATDFSSLK